MKKLTRSSTNKYIFGVCGGLGQYLNIDPTIIRLVWFILALSSFGFFGIAYLVCGFVIPEDRGYIEYDESQESKGDNSKLIIGIGLILIGAYLLARIMFPWLSFTISQITRFWPLLLIVLGVYILVNKK